MQTERFSSLRPSVDLPRLSALRVGPQRPSNAAEPVQHAPWYSIKNINPATTEIYLYGVVGEYGITADDFIRDLADVKASNIVMRINSTGGEVFDGIAIYNAVKRHPANVTAYIDGLGASIASVIAMAADKLVMSPHTQMMIHEAQGFALGTAADMRQLADILDKSSDNIAAIYAERAGGSTAEWRSKMTAETWFSDQEAVDAGLADEVLSEDAPAKPKRAAQSTRKVRAVAPPEEKPDEPTGDDSESELDKPEEPETPAEPKPIDYMAQFQQIVEEQEAEEMAAFGLGAVDGDRD